MKMRAADSSTQPSLQSRNGKKIPGILTTDRGDFALFRPRQCTEFDLLP
jgi:hypothetical protein